jgi:Tfp pilus assembly protein PilV
MKSYRCGSMILEVVVAVTVLAAAMTGTAQLLLLCAQGKQDADHLLAAQVEAANVLERVAAMRYEYLTEQAAQEFKLSPGAEAALPGAQLKAQVIESTSSELPCKRVVTEVSWLGAGDDRVSVRLTGWKYAQAEGPR